ncbi:glutamate racemase [Rhodoblastus sphagnicola]|uniref:Glutamate racemase n=1 Tax=Rhodoblastus sphagnicola TaxID=333368 RepID=A0A2S6N650_9HYPH|nr:glutamate racemase [Rhodoblastus sphagnicola]MBB4196346.1 glutamate racemase [Rhodoblastus sphagnicola]PPQ30096.1 glutamate racemase [Rhodoblastus sphagnicola]
MIRPAELGRPPKILVFDSGLGGLTVLRALMKQRPDADFVYAADDLGFPYGPRPESEVVALVLDAMAKLIAAEQPDCVVIACNTASTLVLPHLRRRWSVPFVGTVPAIKPAAEFSATRMISILATPGTVSRDYTRALIEKFAGHCDVALVGARKLATLAESYMQGEALADAEIAAEIAPCFVTDGARRTDCVVLACTHYPLLRDIFVRLAPWPVRWIDPAPAIARRADHVLREKFPPLGQGGGFRFLTTSGAAPGEKLLAALKVFLPARPEDPGVERARQRAEG